MNIFFIKTINVQLDVYLDNDYDPKKQIYTYVDDNNKLIKTTEAQRKVSQPHYLILAINKQLTIVDKIITKHLTYPIFYDLFNNLKNNNFNIDICIIDDNISISTALLKLFPKCDIQLDFNAIINKWVTFIKDEKTRQKINLLLDNIYDFNNIDIASKYILEILENKSLIMKFEMIKTMLLSFLKYDNETKQLLVKNKTLDDFILMINENLDNKIFTSSDALYSFLNCLK